MQKEGVAAAVIHASCLKPLDERCLREMDGAGTPIFTVEEHALAGGLGSAAAEACARLGLTPPAAMMALPDDFIPHGSREALLQKYGLTADAIAARVKKGIKG